MNPRRPRDRRAACALAGLAFALGGAAALPDEGNAGLERLVSQGRYTEAYARARDEPPQAGESLYLAALSAYNALMLTDARRDLTRLAALGYERRERGWPTVSAMSAGLAASERWTGALVPVTAADGRVAYDRSGCGDVTFASDVDSAASEAYAAASRIAFGGVRPPDSAPPVNLYLFDRNADAAEFLGALDLRARTDGSAASIGLGIMLWRELDGCDAHPGPYGLRATLAHETLHAFQSLMGVEYGPRWTIEGTALMAECLVDPNRALDLRCKALTAVRGDRARVLAALQSSEERFDDYPVYYMLCSCFARRQSLAALGALMRDLNRYHGRSTEDALWYSSALTPVALAAAALRDTEQAPEWAAARDLVALRARAGGDPDQQATELLAAYRARSDEPYLGFLAARALVRAGRLSEARAVISRLERTGYEGAVEGTLTDSEAMMRGTGAGS